jgi:hypothetical protein
MDKTEREFWVAVEAVLYDMAYDYPDMLPVWDYVINTVLEGDIK